MIVCGVLLHPVLELRVVIVLAVVGILTQGTCSAVLGRVQGTLENLVCRVLVLLVAHLWKRTPACYLPSIVLSVCNHRAR